MTENTMTRERKDKKDKEEFKDTKGAIRNRMSKKNRQHNGQKKKYKRTNKQNHELLLLINGKLWQLS